MLFQLALRQVIAILVILVVFAYIYSRIAPQTRNDSLFLSELQCRTTFPDLANEVDHVSSAGPFKIGRQPGHTNGLTQGSIRNGKLYILTANHNMRERRDGVLNQIQRAINTSPESIPDTTFAFTVTDVPSADMWSFSRPNNPQVKGNYWIMPHFSFWSWPKSYIGTMDEVLEKISLFESTTSLEKKIPKAVWRGTSWFNSATTDPRMRPNLLQVTKDQPWADVEDLKWTTNSENATNIIPIEDFCKYKYIIYTEGVSYSGRLPFHQACESVILTPPLNYLMHTTHLMRPLFSSSILTGTPTKDARWPHSYKPSQANTVFIKPDWSDLEATVSWLEANPKIARGIAKRQRGNAEYLSNAAEVCYWRFLIKSWAANAEPDGSWDQPEGVRWETFSVKPEMSALQ